MDAHELTLVAGSRRRLLLSAVAWVAIAILARAGLEALGAGSPWRVPVALLPLPAFLVFLWAVTSAVRGLDEMGRRIHLEALAIAFPLATVFLMVLGLLELAVMLPAEDWSHRHVWPFLPLCYFIGLAIAVRRYR